MTKIKIKNIFIKTYNDFMKNKGTLIPITLLVTVFSLLVTFLQKKILFNDNINWIITFLFVVTISFIYIFFSISFYRTCIKISESKKPKLIDFFTDFVNLNFVLKNIGTSIIAVLLIWLTSIPLGIIALLFIVFEGWILGSISLILSFIVGLLTFYIYTRIFFYFLYAVENKYFYFEAIKKSFKKTKKDSLKIFLILFGIVFILSIFSLIPFIGEILYNLAIVPACLLIVNLYKNITSKNLKK